MYPNTAHEDGLSDTTLTIIWGTTALAVLGAGIVIPEWLGHEITGAHFQVALFVGILIGGAVTLATRRLSMEDQ